MHAFAINYPDNGFANKKLKEWKDNHTYYSTRSRTMTCNS